MDGDAGKLLEPYRLGEAGGDCVGGERAGALDLCHHRGDLCEQTRDGGCQLRCDLLQDHWDLGCGS